MDYRRSAYPFQKVLQIALEQIIAEGPGILVESDSDAVNTLGAAIELINQASGLVERANQASATDISNELSPVISGKWQMINAIQAAITKLQRWTAAVREVMTFDTVVEDVTRRLHQTGDYDTDPRRQAAQEILEGYLDRDDALAAAETLDQTGNESATAWGYMVGGEAIRRAVAVLWP
jgi:hypothetical protein